MKPERPEWVVAYFFRYKRQGVQVLEYQWDWHLHSRTRPKIIAKWGPHNIGNRRGKRKVSQAFAEANAFVDKLEHAWPLTFLVRGYKYVPPKT